jgi:hypothetical protein
MKNVPLIINIIALASILSGIFLLKEQSFIIIGGSLLVISTALLAIKNNKKS